MAAKAPERLGDVVDEFKDLASTLPASFFLRQPTAALKLLAEKPSLRSPFANIEWTSWVLGRQGLEAALGQLDAAIPDKGNRASQSIASRIVQEACVTDPAKALAHLDRLSPSRRTEALSSAVPRWVTLDPAAATAWAKALPPGSDRDLAVTQVFAADTTLSPADATALSNEFQSTSQRLAAVESLGNARHQTDPASAVAWAAGFADPDLRLAAERGIVSSWAKHDALAATDYAFSKSDAGEKARLVKSVAGSLWLPDFSPQELHTFREHASKLPENDQRLLIRESVEARKDQVPEEFRTMLKAAPPAAAFDAIEKFARDGFGDPFAAPQVK